MAAADGEVNIGEWCRNLQKKFFNKTNVWRDNMEKIIKLMCVGDEYVGASTDPEVPKMILKDLFGITHVNAKMTFGTNDFSMFKSLVFYHPDTDHKNAVIFTLDPETKKFMVTINAEMMNTEDIRTKNFSVHE